MFAVSLLGLSACGRISADLVLSRPGSGTLPATSKVELSFEETAVVIAEGGAATLAITLSERRREPTSVDVLLYSSRGDGAADFLPVASSVVIQPNRLSTTLAVSVLDDDIYEGSESFELRISSSDPMIEVTTGRVEIVVNDDETVPIVSFSAPAQSVTESAGPQTVEVALSHGSAFETTVEVSVSNTSAVPSADFTFGYGSVTFLPGETSKTLSYSPIQDSDIEGTETFVITLDSISSGTASISVTEYTHTVSLTDDETLGAFSIMGITGSGDAVLDTNLNGGVLPTINWSTSTGAASYDVMVYGADGSTVTCAMSSTTSTSYNFSSCSLTVNTNYKAKVVAKSSNGSVALAASNDMYEFYVNTVPAPVNDGPYLVMDSEGVVSFNVLADNTATGINDPDGDPDGQILTITAVSSGTKGTSAFTASTVTFDPTATESGVETLTYTVSDGRGGTATATLTIHIMTPHTWTGGAGTTTWATASNWCGTVAATRLSCVGGGTVPGASDKAIFDGTCQSNCSAAMTDGATIELAGLLLDTSYSGTVTQGAGTTIDVGSSYYVQRSGIFQGATGNITSDKFTLTGGEFRSTSNNLHIGFLVPVGGTGANQVDGFTLGALGNFVHRSGRVVFDGISQGNCGSRVPTQVTLGRDVDFWDVELAVAQQLTPACAGAVQYNHDYSRLQVLGDGAFVVLNDFYHKDGFFAGNQIYLKGDLYVSCDSTAVGGVCAQTHQGEASSIVMNGTGTQYYSGDLNGNTVRLVVQKTSGSVEPASTNFRLQELYLQSGTFRAPTGTMLFSVDSATRIVYSFVTTLGSSFLHNNGTVEFANWGSNTKPNAIGADIEPIFYNLTVNIHHTGSDLGVLDIRGGTIHTEGTLLIKDGGIGGGTLRLWGDMSLECPDLAGKVCAEGQQPGVRLFFVGPNTQYLSIQPGAVHPGRYWIIDKDSPTDQVVFQTDATLNFSSPFYIDQGTVNLGNNSLIVNGTVDLGPPIGSGSIVCNAGVGSFSATTLINDSGTGAISCP